MALLTLSLMGFTKCCSQSFNNRIGCDHTCTNLLTLASSLFQNSFYIFPPFLYLSDFYSLTVQTEHKGQWSNCRSPFLESGSKTQVMEAFNWWSLILGNNLPFHGRAAKVLHHSKTLLQTNFFHLLTVQVEPDTLTFIMQMYILLQFWLMKVNSIFLIYINRNCWFYCM